MSDQTTAIQEQREKFLRDMTTAKEGEEQLSEKKARLLQTLSANGCGEEMASLLSQTFDIQGAAHQQAFALLEEEEAAIFEPLTREGQMSLDDWRAPITCFSGCEAILCALQPDFDLGTIFTLRDYRSAAAIAIGNAVAGIAPKLSKPKVEVLRKAVEATNESHEENAEDMLARFFAACDKALSATKKWHISLLDKAVFRADIYAKHGRDYTLHEYRNFVQARKKKEKRKAEVTLLNIETLALLPNCKADRDLTRALMHYPNAWGINEDLVQCYHEGHEGHTVLYQPSEVEKALGDAPQRALTALDERFMKIKSEIVADVIDILFHHWHTTKDRQTNAATINAAKLCQYRNKTLSGENLELHWHALKDAFSFTLRETNGDLKARVFFSESEGESTEGPGAKYVYSPGFMLQYALKGQPLYFAPFLQRVWALDPVRENEAKRLARYLRADWRMNTQDYLTAESGGARAARWHTWAFLLAEAGIDVEAIKEKANRNRLIETIARAVETLWHKEIIAEGGFDIYHPDDREKAESLPARGALDVWLTLRVCLAPSATLREALIETDIKRRAGRERDTNAMASERAKKQLRAQREAKSKPSNS